MATIQGGEKELTYQGKRRTCGFRLSVSDVAVLVAGAALSRYCWGYLAEYSLFIPFTVGHFFLFCNVFRVRRKPELAWTGIFVLNVAAHSFLADTMNMWSVCGLQAIVTVVLITREVSRPDYHGLLSRKINGHIDDYLEGDI
jgi:hypothetical protein